MATSGTITGSFNGENRQYLTFRCDWSVTSQDLANKTSNVRLRWIVTKTISNLYTNKGTTPWSQTCNGTNTSGSLSFNLGNVGANTDYVVRDVTVTIPHNTDGTKTASISGTLDLSGTSAGTGTFSGSMALPTIATTPPTVSSLQLSDVGTTPSSVSAYVAGYTKFRLTATATPVNPATISTYAFYNGNTLLQSGSSNVFTYSSANTAGSYTFKVIVTDSYGNSTTKTNSAVTVVSYSVPTVSATTFRCNSSGTADGSGTYASLKMTWTIANISGNTATVHKVNFNGADTTLTSGTAVIKSGVSTSSAYTATYTVTDSFGNSATISQTVQSEFVNFDLYPDSTTGGMGVGMVAQAGVASFNMPIKPYKGVGITTYTSGIASIDALNSAILSAFSNMSEQTVAWFEYNPSVGLPSPFNTGGVLYVRIEKASAAYGQVSARSYTSVSGCYEWNTSISNNAITGWHGGRQSVTVTNFSPTAVNSWQLVSGLTLSAPTTGMYALTAVATFNNAQPSGIAIITTGGASEYTDWSAVTDKTSAGLTLGTTQRLKTSCVAYLGSGDKALVYAKYVSTSTGNTVSLTMQALKL